MHALSASLCVLCGYPFHRWLIESWLLHRRGFCCFQSFSPFGRILWFLHPLIQFHETFECSAPCYRDFAGHSFPDTIKGRQAATSFRETAISEGLKSALMLALSQ